MPSTKTSNTSKTSKMNALIHDINDHLANLTKMLAPCASDYGFGGAHRMWVKECAILTADVYIESKKQSSLYMMAIPMPPAWGGVRPDDIAETYGHPHTKGKDWRHFENTLRWRFAQKGWVCSCASMNDDEGIAFIAQPMLSAVLGTVGVGDVANPTYTHTATLPDVPFEDWCEKLDERVAGSKIAKQKAALDIVPPSLRPMVAMRMAGSKIAKQKAAKCEFKCRCECEADITSFLSECEDREIAIEVEKITTHKMDIGEGKMVSVPDCSFTFKTTADLGTLEEVLDSITDAHIMRETLTYKENYTGVRVRKSSE